jgi:hypothetical protein
MRRHAAIYSRRRRRDARRERLTRHVSAGYASFVGARAILVQARVTARFELSIQNAASNYHVTPTSSVLQFQDLARPPVPSQPSAFSFRRAWRSDMPRARAVRLGSAARHIPPVGSSCR